MNSINMFANKKFSSTFCSHVLSFSSSACLSARSLLLVVFIYNVVVAASVEAHLGTNLSRQTVKMREQIQEVAALYHTRRNNFWV
jgi:hypothetical protein